MAAPVELRSAALSRPKLAQGVLYVLFSLAAFGDFALEAAENATAHRSRQFPPGAVTRSEDLPASKFRGRLESLPSGPRGHALDQLKRFHFTELDLDSLDTDEEGTILYVDHFDLVDAAPAADPEPGIAVAATPVSPFPSGLLFHSRPGASNVLFLNFSGDSISNTAWNSSLGRTVIQAVPFSTDSDFSTFNDAEQLAIKRIWQRVSEDYAPFEIDVTTERPASFGSRTAHALITRSTDTSGADNPASTAGGVAYVNVFGSSGYARNRPAWIYYDNLASTESYIAEAASHEVGHNLGLSHDGTTAGKEYYGGHGSGEVSWGPLMGTGYGRNVSQWSKGEYYLANNTEDDLAIIAAKISYRTDDHGDTSKTATPLVIIGGTNISSTTPETDLLNTNRANKGILERNTDVDVFSFSTGPAVVRVSVNPWIVASGTRGGNVDLTLELRDASGTSLATNNSATATGAQIQTTLVAGTYYLYIRNSGTGDPLSSTPTGYTSYGSIGQYFISGSIAPVSASPAMVQLTTSVNDANWGTISPASGSYLLGTTLPLLATPAPYYRFVAWTNGLSGTNNPLMITAQTNFAVGAVFAPLLTTNHPTPYWWLASYGYTSNFEIVADALGANGMPLWQSWLAGLNPNLPSSQLRLSVSKSAGNAGPVLSWATATGRLYTIWWSTNLMGTFSRLTGASNLPSTVNRFTNSAAANLRNAFYRLEAGTP